MSDLMLSPIGVESSRFNIRLSNGATKRERPAELTWDLTQPNRGRRLVRVNEVDARELGLFDLTGSEHVAQLLRQMQQSDQVGNVRVAKGLVLSIDAGPARQDLAIAVHHFGGVPVALVPHQLFDGGRPRLKIGDDEFDVEVGIYPDLNRRGTRGDRDPGATVRDCLRSYQIRLDTIFRKYFEDVGEHFHDIENYLSTRDALRRGRDIEDVLAKSVNVKLDQIRTHFKDSRGPLHASAKSLWEKYGLDIVLASHARVFALYMLNQWYVLVGLNEKIDRYRKGWSDAENRAQRWYGDRYDLLVSGATDLGLLSKAFHAFGQNDAAAVLRAHDAATGWVKQFISFARWILALRSDGLEPGVARAFFSGRHGDETTKHLLREISQHYALNHPARARPVSILTVDRVPGQEIEHVVKRRIAFSHALIATVPAGSEGDLEWVIKETEHADLRHKAVAPFVEADADGGQVKHSFATFTKYLTKDEPRIDQIARQHRMSALVSHFAYATFRNGENWHVSADLAEQLDRIAMELRDQMVFDLVLGLLNLFPRQDRRVIAYAMKHTAKRHRPKKSICQLIARDLSEPKLGKVEGMFECAWRKLKTRAIKIDGSEYKLLTSPKKGSYQSDLSSLLRKLRPELSDSERDALYDRVIQAIPGGPGAS